MHVGLCCQPQPCGRESAPPVQFAEHKQDVAVTGISQTALMKVWYAYKVLVYICPGTAWAAKSRPARRVTSE